MEYYTVISSDNYDLSCVAVSQLEQKDFSDLNDEDKFLISEKISENGDQSQLTRTGHMSKFITFGGLKDAIKNDFQYNDLSSAVSSFPTEYVKKTDLDSNVLSVQNFDNPYIISSMCFKNGVPISCDGYKLSDVLGNQVPVVKYSSLSSDKVFSKELSISSEVVQNLSVTFISNQFIVDLSNMIQDGTDQNNKIANESFVSSVVQSEAGFFRGAFYGLDDLVDANSYEEHYGSTVPKENDYIVLSVDSVPPILTSDFNRLKPNEIWLLIYRGQWENNHITGWVPKYKIGDFPFSSAQMDSINSGVTNSNFVKRTNDSQIGSSSKPVYVESGGNVTTCNILTDMWEFTLRNGNSESTIYKNILIVPQPNS